MKVPDPPSWFKTQYDKFLKDIAGNKVLRETVMDVVELVQSHKNTARLLTICGVVIGFLVGMSLGLSIVIKRQIKKKKDKKE